MYAEITFPLHAQRGAAYLTAPNIPARHAFSTRLGGISRDGTSQQQSNHQ